MKTNRVIINSADKFLEHKDEEHLFDTIEENGVFNIDDMLINPSSLTLAKDSIFHILL